MLRWIAAFVVAMLVLPGQVLGQDLHPALQGTKSSTVGPLVSPHVATFEAVADEAPQSVLAVHATEAVEVAQPQVRSRRGKSYMIAGAAALVAGLLIDGDVGTLIAAGGAVLGVYGILLYY